MKKLAKFSVLSAAVTLSVIGVWSLANASGQEQMLASPFIAADQPETAKFASNVVSTGKRNPFSVSTRTSNFSQGEYSGVLIESQNRSITPRGLDTLGFSYKGNGEAIIEYTGPQMVINRATAKFGSGKSLDSSPDGFKKVSFNTSELGIPANSSIHKIVIAPPPGGVGRILVDEITLNGDPVKKALHTVFYKVVSSSPSGPLAAVAAPGSCPPQATLVTLKNSTNRPVQIFFTLGVVNGCLQDVQAVFGPNMQHVGGPLIGSITLAPQGSPGDSISSISGNACVSGSFSADSVRFNCATDKFPNGQSLAEFIVNNFGQGGSSQETVDISCVTGVNAIWQFTMDGGQSDWTTTKDTRTTPHKTEVVRKMRNDQLFNNIGSIGVFPFGCTNCSDNAGVPCCAPGTNPGSDPNSSNPPGCANQGPPGTFPPAPSTQWNPNPPHYPTCNPTYAPICNVQRPSSCNGGTILIEYLGPGPSNKKALVIPPKQYQY